MPEAPQRAARGSVGVGASEHAGRQTVGPRQEFAPRTGIRYPAWGLNQSQFGAELRPKRELTSVEWASDRLRGTVAVQDAFEVAHEHLRDLDAEEIAASLQDLLGQKLVAFALGDKHPKTVGRYARGAREPDDDAYRRLVDLFLVAEILKTGMRPQAVKSWMLGANPRLRGKAPIEVLHEGKPEVVRSAARAFVTKH